MQLELGFNATGYWTEDMKILWICNTLPAVAAEKLGKKISVKEGWLTGTLQKILEQELPEDDRIELAIAYPVNTRDEETRQQICCLEKHILIYGFYEEMNQPHNYCMTMERRFRDICKDFAPDVVHAFGTEYPHTLAMARIMAGSDRMIISLQGIISKCGEEYLADLTDDVVYNSTMRDLLKKDNIAQQQAKFLERGEFEKEAIALVRHVTGRTDFDRRAALEYNPRVIYHYMGETLRTPFYSDSWELKKCERHSIFVSQGDYPLKGLHYLLEAMPEILEYYPDARIKVAGNNIVEQDSFYKRLKIGGYGKYLNALIQTYRLRDKIEFLGPLIPEEMKLQYIRCHTFVCPSAIENSPNSLGEAMILGAPVVASRVGGIPSILHEPEEGILFEKANSTGLAEAIIRIWKDDNLAEAMSARERERARDNYNRDDNFRMLMSIYKRLSGLEKVE